MTTVAEEAYEVLRDEFVITHIDTKDTGVRSGIYGYLLSRNQHRFPLLSTAADIEPQI